MLKNSHQYSMEIYKGDGTRLGQTAISPDWDPAFEWTCFEGIRSARLDPMIAAHRGSVEPLWHAEKGPPYVGGFRVTVSAAGIDPVCEDFPSAYFRKAAGKAARSFIGAGLLCEGEGFQFLTTAFQRPAPEPPASRRRIVIEDEELREPWPIVEGSMPRVDPSAPDSPDVPVFIPRAVLDDVAALTRGAGPVETGGVLIGHLRQDGTRRDIFVEVTGHIPGQNTIAELEKLTFTPETWTHARRVTDLRARGEVMLGWWHSHVGREVCKGCPEERRRACRFSQGFFSTHDGHFHRTAFSRAYHIGLVVNDPAAGEISFSLFGWRRGLIEPRDFHVTGLMDIPLPFYAEENGENDQGEPHVANTKTR